MLGISKRLKRILGMSEEMRQEGTPVDPAEYMGDLLNEPEQPRGKGMTMGQIDTMWRQANAPQSQGGEPSVATWVGQKDAPDVQRAKNDAAANRQGNISGVRRELRDRNRG